MNFDYDTKVRFSQIITYVSNLKFCTNFPGKWFIILTAAIVLLSISPAKSQDFNKYEDVILISGCEYDYPPYCFEGADGEAAGFSVELMKAALRVMRKEVVFKLGPWEEVKGWLERGDVDALPLVGRTPEREEIFDFTFPYLSMHGAIIVHEDTRDVEVLNDLAGRKVAVMKGDNAEEFLRREDYGLIIETTATFKDALLGLSEKKYDAVVIQRIVGLHLIQEMGLQNVRIVSKPIYGFRQDFCFAVRDGDRETLSLLNEGLSLVKVDGTYRYLHARWFSSLELPVHRKIIIGGDYHFPPYEFLDEEGNPRGFNVDIIRAIAREMDLEVEFHLAPWTDIMEGLLKGNIDLIQGMFYSAERDILFDFTQPHTLSHYVTAVRRDTGIPPMTLEDLKNHSIAVETGDIMHDYTVENGFSNNIKTYQNQEEVLIALRRGEVTCALIARQAALFLIDKNNWQDIVVGQKPFISLEYCFAVQQNNQTLLNIFSEGLTIIEKSGEYREIYDKWLGVYPDSHLDWKVIFRYMLYVAIPLVVIILLVFLWVNLLRKKVAHRTGELQEAKENLQDILDSVVFGVMIVGFDKIIYRSNQRATEMCGYEKENEIIGKKCHEILCPEKMDCCPVLDQGNMNYKSERILYTRDGREIPIFKSVSKIILQGKPYLLESFIDITEQKKAKDQIQMNLKEKELLLRELYHRTKNNMQVISAFMHLRSRQLKDEYLKGIFRDLETKIISMALVHKKLYESQDLSRINLKEYYNSLIELMKETYDIPEKNIEIHCSGDDVQVLIDEAIPLGLILNELITNSVKFAFSGRTDGLIKIHIKSGKKTLTILYSDNGSGLPEGFDLNNDSKLGLETIRALVNQQLMGTMEIENINGLQFRFTFTEKLYHARV